ncbi:enoyl-CoA hydratase/isomerase family protein [Xanthobacter aminoxidans]|uniref:enoyl-CoA hydratase/isomerase family protein n=1 Tax=Xanthobacter aminoxidans TaxID=186280 RepID=UPI0037269EFA
MSLPSTEVEAEIRLNIEGGVATILLNRPDKLNAFNDPMLTLWEAAIREVAADDAVRAVILTGAGRAFCSGGDVDKMGSAEMTPLQVKERLTKGIQRITHAMAALDKPAIAAINGVAAGAGLDIALMCDLRFMALGAKVAETYFKLGLVPGAGGAHYLPRIVGPAKALEMFWSADYVGAEECLRIGLVNRIYPDAELMEQARAFARRIAAGPPLSARLIKRAVYQGLDTDLSTSLDLVSSHMTIVRSSRDHVEAVAALREKRTPRFEGR